MSNKIKLELTKKQFEALISMIEENAIMAGTSDEEFKKNVDKNLVHINKMFKSNGINTKITY
jgi:hypothetical protein